MEKIGGSTSGTFTETTRGRSSLPLLSGRHHSDEDGRRSQTPRASASGAPDPVLPLRNRLRRQTHRSSGSTDSLSVGSPPWRVSRNLPASYSQKGSAFPRTLESLSRALSQLPANSRQ